MKQPTIHTSLTDLVDEIIDRRGPTLNVALPLGLGKPNHIINELVRRACEGQLEQLTIYTALSLLRPSSSQSLQQRLMEPIVDRLYGDYPDLLYTELRRSGQLPDNITVHEFYVAPGSILGNDRGQQDYLSINYTQAFRVASEVNLDLLIQMVAPTDDGYDLSSNTDISIELIELLNARDDNPLVVGQVNRRLPVMGRQATISSEKFDLILEGGAFEHELFSKPSMPPTDDEFAIGLRVASLLKDGGTIQLGIGNLGDTVSWSAIQRDTNNDVYTEMLEALEPKASDRHLAASIGGIDPFERGLYCCSEMLTGGLLAMFSEGLIRRTVGDGVAMHAAFFFGSPDLYQGLRELTPEQRHKISMSSVRWTNLLYGDEETKRAQRKDGRFVNEAMMVTLMGAVVSDQLEDGRVVSGVGGQFEFVTMANALEDGRSIIMIPSVRESHGKTTSNIRWTYGHTTIPRHMRDIVVTEYGVADLRDKSDRQVIEAMLEVSDSRFQDELAQAAMEAGKLPADYEIPQFARTNTPERIRDTIARFRRSGAIPRCPLGSSLTDQELDLVEALQYLKGVTEDAGEGRIPSLDLEGLKDAVRIPDSAEPYLRRMGLNDPENASERAYRRLLVYALGTCGFV